MRFLIIISLFALCGIADGQDNAQLVSLTLMDNGKTIKLSKPTYISQFNTAGYNNQPSFIDGATCLISSDYKAIGLTDILTLDLESLTVEKLTQTDSVGEYSPTLSKDGKRVFCVRQEGKNQFFWSYPLDRTDYGINEGGSLTDVGYFLPLGPKDYVMFRVTEPMAIYRVNTETHEQVKIMENGGRCMKKLDDEHVLLVQKSETDLVLHSYNVNTHSLVPKYSIPGEDFEILPSGTLLTAKGSKIYQRGPDDNQWMEVVDLQAYGIVSIDRMTALRNKLIIVTHP